jgi:hypothetical protein
MKYLKKFENHIESELLLESTLIYSDNLLKTIGEIDSRISKTLIELNNKSFDSSNICFIDIKDKDNLSYKIETKTGERKQEIKIGRMLTKLIKLSQNNFSDSEKEDFINKFKANLSVDSSNFKIYEGDDIYKFYSSIDYDKHEGIGQLGKSCMNKKPKEFFDLYTKNTNKVQLLVLEKEEQLVGRCLLWNTDNGFKFMDRIYTYLDSDIELFKIYGNENGFFYKELQNTSYRSRDNFNYRFNIRNKDEVKNEAIVVSLDSYDVRYYPYLDSLCYFNSETGQLSNHLYEVDADLLLCNTDGGYKDSDFEW